VEREDGHERDFLTVGSMGHASSIALGIAMQKHRRQVYKFTSEILSVSITPDLNIAKIVHNQVFQLK
jgi:hypothetical protein